MRDAIEVFGGLFVAILVLVGTLVASLIVYQLLIDKPACEAIGKRAGVETFFSLGTNCLVKSGDQWVKYEVYFGQKQEITIKQK